MGAHDDYARKKASRLRAYRAAYQSDEAQAWIASLPPGKREQAEQRGLLRPLEDRDCYDRCIEELPAHLEPRQDAGIDGGEPALLFRRAASAYEWDTGWAELLQQTENKAARLFQAFLAQDGNPRLRWACIRYLTGEGTCKSHARGLGISRQAFHYHVRKLSKQLGLPPMGNQKGRPSHHSHYQSDTL